MPTLLICFGVLTENSDFTPLVFFMVGKHNNMLLHQISTFNVYDLTRFDFLHDRVPGLVPHLLDMQQFICTARVLGPEIDVHPGPAAACVYDNAVELVRVTCR